jgi:hypothetical protein
LSQFLDDQRVDYLVTFPGWYPQLVSRAQFLYRSEGKASPALGGENIAVYAWPRQ